MSPEMRYLCLDCRRGRPRLEASWRAWLPVGGLAVVLVLGMLVSLQQIAHAAAYRPVGPETVSLCPTATPSPAP